MEIEIMKQNKKISTFDEIFSQQTKIMEANEKHLKKGNKEDNASKLQKLTSENFKETKQAIDKLKGIAETNQSKILEIIRKNSTAQTNANKKTIEEMKKCNELILRKIMAKIDNIYNEFVENVENLKTSSEENFKTKFDSLKTLILNSHSSIKESIASQKIQIANSTFYKRPIPQATKQNDLQNEQFNFVKQMNISSVPLSNTSYRIKKEDSVFSKAPPYSITQGSVHTPLVEVMQRNKTPNVNSSARGQANKIPRLSEFNHEERNTTPSIFNYIKQNGTKTFSIAKSDESLEIVKEVGLSPCKFPKPSQKYLKTYSTKFNYKTKDASSKPRQLKKVQATNEFCSAFESNFTRNDSMYAKKTIANKRNLRSNRRFINDNESDTRRSSPYLTIYEATRRTEEFGFL